MLEAMVGMLVYETQAAQFPATRAARSIRRTLKRRLHHGRPPARAISSN
jgi:hypothetical protein